MNDRPVPDQRGLWIATYDEHRPGTGAPSAFAVTCLDLLPPLSHILELGCGAGNDAAAFAAAGHTVIATDFAPNVIAANRARLADLSNLAFEEMRIEKPYPFPDAALDAVYAHLTLHYYFHDITSTIVREIRRVLRPGGWLMFACKSPDDPAWGRGVEIEPDMFDLNGKVRHFFTPDYARALLADGFTDIQVASHRGRIYGTKSGWITATARTATTDHSAHISVLH
jgi:SAM-dependent methyltransferase